LAVSGISSPAAEPPGDDPAARPSSQRSSLEMVHWTISPAFGGPLFTH